MSSQKISTCLWFDPETSGAEEAAHFYRSVFENTKIHNKTYYTDSGQDIHGQPEGQVMTVDFEIEGHHFTALNGGSQFQFNPSLTFFVVCETAAEVDALWEKLIEGGETMMPLDSYPWSDRYGWLADCFGISWQIYQGKLADVGQKITPLFFFTGSIRGKAEEAINFYSSIFPESKSEGVAKYGADEPGPEGMVKHGQFKLAGQTFMAMDSGVENDFPFNEAISLVINCESQKEVDNYWEQLLNDGGSEMQCGWLRDRFGVVWQIVPTELKELLKDPNPERGKRVTEAMMPMKKLDINILKKA